MAYIKFNSDPISKRLNTAFANLCNPSYETKDTLSLVNGAFTVFGGSTPGASFPDLQKFNFPVDTASSIQFEICAGETLVLFDNALDSISATTLSGTSGTSGSADYPLGNGTEYIQDSPIGSGNYYLLTADRNYVRGFLLYVNYPTVDKNGDEILAADFESNLTIVNRNLEEFTIPVCQFFAHFANPETRGADGLINKIEITNPRDNFSIKINALLIYAKSSIDPNTCSC